MSTYPSNRLVSLDAFRGLTIAGMILVNTPGDWNFVYSPLRHASWNGCTPTDLVFPFFLYIVGVAMWYSFKKFGHRATPEWWRKVALRALLIFVIGLALNVFPFDQPISEWRIMGVLQRIAVAFFFGAIACVLTPKRWLHWLAGGILILYWLLMAALGGDAPYSLEDNFARAADVVIFGADHIYQGFGMPFDPEGLISSIPAVVTVIIGYLVGSYIDATKLKAPALASLFIYGCLGILLGLVWNEAFPINKPLWTSSYVVYTAGIATLLLTLFLWIIDVLKYRKWAHPLVVFGVNPLFIYALSIVFIKILSHIQVTYEGADINARQWAYEAIFAPLAGPVNGSLFFALTYVAIHLLIAWILYRRSIFIKV